MTMNSVPLELLLRIDNHFPSANALACVLGDRYLYAGSEIFARIRNTVLKDGYSFVERESPLWHDYLAFPLLSLHDIIGQKAIPYFENVSVIRRTVDRQNSIEFPLRFLLSTLKKNYVLHESSHCVAYRLLQEDGTVLAGLAQGRPAWSARARFRSSISAV